VLGGLLLCAAWPCLLVVAPAPVVVPFSHCYTTCFGWIHEVNTTMKTLHAVGSIVRCLANTSRQLFNVQMDQICMMHL
jgi:hypothetical protein